MDSDLAINDNFAKARPAMPSPGRERFASIDLGSNSFRLWQAELDQDGHLNQLSNHKVPVRLAAGLGKDGFLDDAARERARVVLQKFAEILQLQGLSNVRIVATSTLRSAKNAASFLREAELLLGHEVEVISGMEEARLIYKGVAHQLPSDGLDRLVIDIGGGSTECIIGNNHRAKLVESAAVGCVMMSSRFFPNGEVTALAMEQAVYFARDYFAPIAKLFRDLGWRYAIGTSGTAKSLTQVAQTHFHSGELSLDALRTLSQKLIDAKHVDQLQVDGLKPERRPVLAGGLAVMQAAFEELGIDRVNYSRGALRQGALYDLIERREGQDIQAASVQAMMQRYAVDSAQAMRMSDTASAMFEALSDEMPARWLGADFQQSLRALQYAAQLSEIGLAIAHEDFNIHGNYILSRADMVGFSKPEQSLLAQLTLGQRGAASDLSATFDRWAMLLCLRWSAILHRQRSHEPVTLPVWQGKVLNERAFALHAQFPAIWKQQHQLTAVTLVSEVQMWNAEVPSLKVSVDFV